MESILSALGQQIAHGEDEGMSLLSHYARDLRQKETQEEILNLLLDTACNFAPRIALFTIRKKRFCGWSTRGYPGETALRLSACSLAPEEAPFLQNSSEAALVKTLEDKSGEEALRNLLGGDDGEPWHAVPLFALGRPVAILFAQSTADSKCHLEALNTIMVMSGLCLENLALKIMQETPTAAAVRPARETLQPAKETAPEPVPEPEAVPAESAAFVEPESEPVQVESPGEAPASWTAEPAPFEEEPEPPRAPEPAIPLGGPTEQPQQAEPAIPLGGPIGEPARPEPVPVVAPATAQGPSEDEKLHADAKRFARLLVSEIKLYNEQRVVEGRQHHDLYLRLKRDIDRSREMYNKRVAPIVKRRMDYLHEEIVRILGQNDPASLGGDYPGPVVES